MFTAATLETLREQSDRLCDQLEGEAKGLNNIIDGIQGRIELMPVQKDAMIKDARGKSVQTVTGPVARVRELWERARPHEELWKDTALVLSKLPYDSSASTDALVRMEQRQRLASLPVTMLLREFEEARLEQNWPKISSIWSARLNLSASAKEQVSHHTFNLNGLAIPGQGSALASIARLRANNEFAEAILSGVMNVRGGHMSTRLNVARSRQVSARMVAAAEAIDAAG